MGHVLLADLPRSELLRVLRTPSQSGIIPRIRPSRRDLERELVTVRGRGWALSDQRLSLGIRSIAAPVRDASGATAAAVNVTVHAAETSVNELKRRHLPLLLSTAEAITLEFMNLARLPVPDPLGPT
jgi:IclR family transcriptional regulator, pca regulon regulatory protein